MQRFGATRTVTSFQTNWFKVLNGREVRSKEDNLMKKEIVTPELAQQLAGVFELKKEDGDFQLLVEQVKSVYCTKLSKVDPQKSQEKLMDTIRQCLMKMIEQDPTLREGIELMKQVKKKIYDVIFIVSGQELSDEVDTKKKLGAGGGTMERFQRLMTLLKSTEFFS